MTGWANDTILAGKAALGDRRAFDMLVKRHALPLRRFLLRLTADAALADDLAQETFVKAYSNIATFGGLANFRTWLFRIAYNTYYSYRRNLHETEPLEDGPIEENFACDVNYDMKLALACLKEIERTVILLYYMEDFSVAKVAGIMSLPSGTVKSHLKRGRDKLEKFLMTNGYGQK